MNDVEFLKSKLGQTLTACVAGFTSRASLRGPLSPDEAAKLATARQVWEIVTTDDSDAVARSWFVGMNPMLDDRAPVLCIRDGMADEVLAAAKNFREMG